MGDRKDSELKTVEMFVGGLVLDPGTQAPIVVLKDETGKIALPIWIGIAEATSIAAVVKRLSLARPMTHDLMQGVFDELGVKVQSVVITDLRDATYFAELILVAGERAIILDARPSDAIAIALRASAPIFVAQHVLDQARVAFGSGASQGGGQGDESAGPGNTSAGTSPDEGQSEQDESDPGGEKDFKHIDKDKWSEILAELDPDDFKYKM